MNETLRAPFGKTVGDARVVAIGESAHGIHEFYEIKDQLLRYLVSELGFTAFVMESGFAEGLMVNDWILGGPGDLQHVARAGITYRFGECEEMRRQLQWMRNWNATHERKLHFYGMDLPGSSANPGPAVAACLARLEPQPEDAQTTDLANFTSHPIHAMKYFDVLNTDVREMLSERIRGLVQRARESRDEIAERCALSAAATFDMLRFELHPVAEQNPRDAYMAQTVEWILERESRVVIGAHNAHVQRGLFRECPMLGTFLAPKLGENLRVFGTTYASGKVPKFRNLDPPFTKTTVALEELEPPPAGTTDAVMAAANTPFLDLQSAPDARDSIRAMRVNHDVVTLTTPRAFDGLLHFQRVTPILSAFEHLQNIFNNTNGKDLYERPR